MFKLLLVDDEPIIRKGIKTSIDWSKYDIEISGEASNGKDALEKALVMLPEIVITDIRMPIMDGLSLSESLKKMLPDTKIIILSGYEDFSYAKKALSLGVTEYLLKPVGAEELISLIVKVKNDITSGRVKKNLLMKKNIILNENYLQIKSNLVNKLLKNEFTSADYVFEQAEMMNLDLTGPEFLVFVISMDDFLIITEGMPDKEKELMKFSVINISEELLSSFFSGLVCYSEFDHLIGVINGKNLDDIIVNDFFREIQQCINKYLKLSISIGIGSMSASILDISRSYSEALAALKNKIFLGKGLILQHKSVKAANVSEETVLYPFSEEKEILNYLKALNTEGIAITLNNIFNRFDQNSATPENIKNICCRLVVIAVNCIEEMGINFQNSFGTHFNPYMEIEKLEILDDLYNWLIAFFNRSILLIQENKTLKFKSIIKFALHYIEQNYNRDISLNEIANMVYVTPNYLSRIFKEEMNVNFVDWLNKLRIEKAKALLLETTFKTYEVADKVGYRDYKYFSYIFKKITGNTPKEFKESRTF